MTSLVKNNFLLLLLVFVIIATNSGYAQQQVQSSPPPDSNTSGNPIQKLDENRYKIGNLVLDSKLRQIFLQGKVNMQKGMIELVACAPGGKVHECVLVIDVIPYHLQVALLLLGLQYTGGLEYQGDPRTPKGDSVIISVSWSSNGRDTIVRAEDLVWNIQAEKSMVHTPWIFAGSKTQDGKFMADQEKSLITTYHDPFTIFDNPLAGGSNDDLYKVNEQLTPPKGTPVTVIIQALH